MTSNTAAWIKERTGSIEFDAAEVGTPASGELLVQVEAVSFNPIDAKIQRLDLFGSKYPLIGGFTFAGTVISTSPDLASIKPGDRVAVGRWGATAGDNRFGAFQKYALAKEQYTLKLDPETPLEDGAGVIANLATVVSALNIFMGLSKPPLTGKATANGKRVLVYGGSSAVGGLAVKYAVDAGYEVVTTSSAGNRGLVGKRGAKYIIDHSKPREGVIREIREYGPYEGIFESIGSQATTGVIVDLLRETGGEFFSTSPSPGDESIPANVKKTWAGYSDVLVAREENRELFKWYLKEYLPVALKSGAVWPNPAQWLEGGLNSTQKALDLLYEGKVSAKKVLVNPQD